MQKIEKFDNDIKNAIEKNGGETSFTRYAKNKNLKDFESIFYEKDL